MNVTSSIIHSLEDLSGKAWNQLILDSNPFIKYEFLSGLERFDCLQHQGWTPAHVIIKDGDDLIAALPQYLKMNSIGEFVFDWEWADAYERAGGQYYPKLVSAIPFAPVTGPRLLINPELNNSEEIIDLLLHTVLQFIKKNNLSSFHCLFPYKDELAYFKKYGFQLRLGCQYHWFNNDYADFNDFLNTLDSKHRKNIKRERKSVQDQRIEIEILEGNNINDYQWEVFHRFYCSTFYRKWGKPRLTLDFFKSLSRNQPEATVLLLAKMENEYIAGAYAMLSNDTFYGRHWGCSTHVNNLHFELCYYKTIEYCIKHKLKCLDAGAQGEHKLNRGFVPVETWSAHWIDNQKFRQAVEGYLLQERNYIEEYMKTVNQHLPYKQYG